MFAGIEIFQIQHVERLGRPFVNRLAPTRSFEADPDIESVLQVAPRLIHILNHGPSLAPYVVGAYVAQEIVRAGGGQRVPFAAVHRNMFRLPIVKDLIARSLGARRAFTFEDVVNQFQNGNFTDFVLSPEGSNEMRGNPYEVRPFKSHRYIELSIRLDIPMLLTAHRGTEDWTLSLRFSDFTASLLSWMNPRMAQLLSFNQTVNVQGVPTPLQQLRVKSLLYKPELKYDELADHPRQRQLQLREESEKVRKILSRMLGSLDATYWGLSDTEFVTTEKEGATPENGQPAEAEVQNATEAKPE